MQKNRRACRVGVIGLVMALAACGGGGTGGTSGTGGDGGSTLPQKPTGFTATASGSKVALAWDPQSGMTFKVQRGPSAGSYAQSFTSATNSYTDTTTQAGQTYFYVVAAVSGAETSTNSDEKSVALAPASPTLSPITLDSTKAAVLVWSASAGATAYKITRTPAFAASVIVQAPAVSYTDAATGAGSTYAYAVAATDAGGDSAASSSQSITLAPASPTLSAIAVDPTNAPVLTWSASAGATSYQITRTPAFAAAVAVQPPTVTYTDSAANADVPYAYTVIASNGGGASAASASQGIRVLVGPTGVTVALVAGKPHLTWTAAAQATGYVIYRGVSAAAETNLASVGAVTSYDDVATPGSTFFYAVASSGPSNGASAPMQGGSVTSPPAAVTGLSGAGGCNSVIITWTAATGATNYLVTRDTSAGGTFATVVSGTPSGTTTLALTDSGAVLTNNTQFFYRVIAHDAGGDSAAANTSATTGYAAPAFIDPHGGTMLAYAGDTQVSLTWAAPAGAPSNVTYDLLRASASGPFATVKTGYAATSLTDTGLVAATPYFYQVRATGSGCLATAVNGTTGASGSAITQKGGAQMYNLILDGTDPAAILRDLTFVFFTSYRYDSMAKTITNYPGAGTADGYFTIPNVPSGMNYVDVGSGYLETDTRQFDLASAYVGRNDAVAANTATPVTVGVSSLAPWDTADLNDGVEVFSAGAGFDVYADLLAQTAPANGATSLSLVDHWMGTALVDASKGDQLFITDIGNVAGTPFKYGAIQRFCNGVVTPATMVDGSAATISCAGNAAMAAVTPINTTLKIARSQFKTPALVAGNGPVPVAGQDTFNIFALPEQSTWGRLSGGQVEPTLVQMALDTAVTDLSETLTYANPMPAKYGTNYHLAVKTNLAYTAPTTTACPTPAPFTIRENFTQNDALLSGQLPSNIVPNTLPVTGVTVTPLTALTAGGIGQPVSVSWIPPSGAANAPTSYDVFIYQLGLDASCNTTVTFRAYHAAQGNLSAVVIPPDRFTAGTTYYAAVRARWYPDELPNFARPYLYLTSVRSTNVSTFSAAFTR